MRLSRNVLYLALASVSCSSDAGSADTDLGTSTTDAGSSGSTSEAESSSSGNPACQTLALDLGEEPCIRFQTHEVADFVDEACGPVTCSPRTGPADGQLPSGLVVGPDCTFRGTIGDDRVGGWAQIVDVSRDGQSVAVPFCAVQESTPAGYAIEFSPGPVVAQTFDPGAPISTGDPELRVRPANDCPAADCSFAFAREIVPGGFDPGSVIVGGSIEDEGGTATLVQPITASADEVGDEFTSDPWVFNVQVDYCMQPEGACNLINPQTDAMDAFSSFSLIMRPTQ